MVQSILDTINHFWNDERGRFLLIGVGNTLFGYGISLLFYYSLNHWLHLVIINSLATIVAITFSFFTLKLFVFKTKGSWFREYLRCYVVYTAHFVVGTILLIILVDFLSMPFWLAQGLLMCCMCIFSYFGHSRYSFRKP